MPTLRPISELGYLATIDDLEYQTVNDWYNNYFFKLETSHYGPVSLQEAIPVGYAEENWRNSRNSDIKHRLQMLNKHQLRILGKVSAEAYRAAVNVYQKICHAISAYEKGDLEEVIEQLNSAEKIENYHLGESLNVGGLRRQLIKE